MLSSAASARPPSASASSKHAQNKRAHKMSPNFPLISTVFRKSYLLNSARYCLRWRLPSHLSLPQANPGLERSKQPRGLPFIGLSACPRTLHFALPIRRRLLPDPITMVRNRRLWRSHIGAPRSRDTLSRWGRRKKRAYVNCGRFGSQLAFACKFGLAWHGKTITSPD